MTDRILRRNPGEYEPQCRRWKSSAPTLQCAFHVMIARETRGFWGEMFESAAGLILTAEEL